MSTLNVVQQLYNLSKDPDHREGIVRDQGCLPALVMFLRNNNSEPQVITLTLETLNLLSENDKNKITMSKEPGLLSQLQYILDSYHSNQEQLDLTNKILDKINNKTQPSNNENINTSNTLPSTTTTKSTTFSMLIGEKLPIKEISTNKLNTSSNSNSNISNKPIQTYTFHIKGMNTQAIKTQVEDCLLKTRGVISFMIDLHTYQATIRTSLTTDEVKMTIRNNIGLSASLVVDGQEETESLPDYLPEPSKDSSQNKKSWGWGSIISFGYQDQSKPVNTQNNNNKGWGSSLSKALFG